MTLPDLTRLPLAQKRAILAALGKAKSSTVAPILSKNGSTHSPVRNVRKKAMDFSLLFFSEECSESEQDRYYLVRECAQFADQNGFKAIWVPERHFHRFGAIYPNPAVLAAALASITRNIRLRAGSVVLPLEDPLRVVEAWAMVDNLSGGRVDISFASGWNPNDFVLSPETFARTKEVLSERIQEVRHLWRGGTVQRKNGKGEAVEIRAFPSPIQRELDTWFTAAGNPKTFDEAGRLGCNLLTMLFSSSLEELSQKIQSYRRSWERANNVGEGCVTLMLHSFLNKSPDVVREKVRAPFLKYIRSSLDVQRLGQAAPWDEKQLDQMAEFAYERYYRTGALFGTPESCFNLVNSASESGVNEIACQLDFGIDAESILRSLPYLKDLKEKYELSLTPVAIQNPGWKQGSASSVEAGFSGKVNGAEVHPVGDAIAIVGMSGRFPQADTLDEFWENLISGRNVFTEFPMSRGPVDAGSRFQGGFLKDIECFDAKFFGLSVREAALMDPHQRLFLETTWAAIEDAGYEPGKLAGSKTGVWVGMYSPDFNQRISGTKAADSESLLGRLNVMVANRVSYLLDLRGPSEIVDTACSSSLVAIDRAIQSLRSGECEMAIAGGVSLLLSAVSTEWLGSVEMLSSAGICRPFDARANGLVRGEGVGAVLLKPLRSAIRDADHIYAVIRGSGTNHNGRREGSLTTPSLSAQADLLVQTYSSAAIDPQTIDYIEAHGAASELGDYVEINAYKRAFARLAPLMPKDSCGIGTVKANIGALDSAGGIAALIKVVLAFEKQQWPGMSGDLKIRPDFELEASPFYFVEKTEAWIPNEISGKPVPRRAGIHAFGLGGVNAHIVLEEYLQEKRADGNEQGTLTPRRTISPSVSRFARRRYPLPYKATGSQFPQAFLHSVQPRPGGAVFRTRFSASDPLVSDHVVHSTPIVAATLMCETVHMAAAVFGLGRVYRIEGICFPNPLELADSKAQIEARLEVEVTGLSACFNLRSDLNCVHAEGTVEWTEVSQWLDERIDILEKRTGHEIDSEQFYARFEKLGITYGSLYRTVQSVTYNETEAFAIVSLPPGFESGSTGFEVHPGLLDAVLQLGSVFSLRDNDCIHLPFCIESLEWRGPMTSNGFAYLRKLASENETALHRFDGGIADATGRIIAVLTDICLKPVTENRKDSLESILKRVADGSLSVEAADRLLSGTSPKQCSSVESFAARLSSRYPTAEFTFKLSLDDEIWSIDVKKGTSTTAVDSAGERLPIIKLSRRHFEQLLAGECDPTVLFLRGAIELSPENAHALKQKIGGYWFEKFNAKRLPIRFRDLLAGTLYAHGEVVLPSGLKRELFPWTISAEAGAILYEMILREKPERTLEIGMAYGLSSLFICQAHHDKGGGDHVAIDPCQREEFLAIGLHNVEKAGLSQYLRFMEQADYVALPLLLAEGKPYQFVFIDGLHMFDYTILDFFYCDRLLTEDGILFFDDCLAPGVAKVVEYVRTNRRYEPLVINCERLAGFRKKASDLRSLEDPNFHKEF